MLHGKRAVFFDAGFTLLEPVRSVASVYWDHATKLADDLDESTFRERMARKWRDVNRRYRSGHPELESSEELEREAWRLFTAEVARPFPSLAAAHAEWFEGLIDHFDRPDAWRPMAHAEELLDALVERDVVLGVVSNWHSALHGILEGHDLKRRFRFVLTSAEARRKKPHGEIFAKALALADAKPEETVHVGDSWDDDVEGALAAGLSAVFVGTSPGSPGIVPAAAHLGEIRAALG